MSGAATPERVAVVGLGLIGGSLALALAPRVQVWGYDRDAAALEQAAAAGLDAYSTERIGERIGEAQVVVIATPGMQVEGALRQLRDLPEDICITDTGSTKDSVFAAARRLWPEGRAALALSHPLAGHEESGFSAARADLFASRVVLICASDASDSTAVQRVERMWQLAGGVPVGIAVEEHDATLALTSHLPHLLAFSLVRLLVDEVGEAGFDYTGGGFRDFSRIAASSPEMWADIAINNAGPLGDALAQYGAVLGELGERIEAGDRDWVHDFFTGAAQARRRYYSGKDS